MGRMVERWRISAESGVVAWRCGTSWWPFKRRYTTELHFTDVRIKTTEVDGERIQADMCKSHLHTLIQRS